FSSIFRRKIVEVVYGLFREKVWRFQFGYWVLVLTVRIWLQRWVCLMHSPAILHRHNFLRRLRFIGRTLSLRNIWTSLMYCPALTLSRLIPMQKPTGWLPHYFACSRV